MTNDSKEYKLWKYTRQEGNQPRSSFDPGFPQKFIIREPQLMTISADTDNCLAQEHLYQIVFVNMKI